MVDEPLIFVEVALTETIPGAIAPLLAVDRQPVPIERARTAVFYSISNCQRGLGGISFGNFLIKQVVEELRRELPKLDTFVTLSPVPGFMKWLKKADDLNLSNEDQALVDMLADPLWVNDTALTAQLKPVMEQLAAHYFLKAKSPRGGPIDSVARFHLGNGARLERIDWLGDTSAKGLRESASLMVNYLYRLDDIEKNHEAYADHYEIAASSAVKKLLKSEKRRWPAFAGQHAAVAGGVTNFTSPRLRGEVDSQRAKACEVAGEGTQIGAAHGLGARPLHSLRTSSAPLSPPPARRRMPARRAKKHPSLTRLAVLHIELAHGAADDEVIVVQHQRPRDAVLIEFERHRIDRRLLAAVGAIWPICRNS